MSGTGLAYEASTALAYAASTATAHTASTAIAHGRVLTRVLREPGTDVSYAGTQLGAREQGAAPPGSSTLRVFPD
eukprot:2830680-Rhodomonas_salina.2